jgi:hypothetical protein
MLLDLGVWVPIVDGDPAAAAMYDRHYSSGRSAARRRASGSLYICGPSERLILMTPCRRALFAWRRHKHRMDGLVGVECSIFRNEGAGRSSDLIREADRIAFQRWPQLLHFTFVDAAATAGGRTSGARPGHCYRRAGWKLLRGDDGTPAVSQERGLHILTRRAPL